MKGGNTRLALLVWAVVFCLSTLTSWQEHRGPRIVAAAACSSTNENGECIVNSEDLADESGHEMDEEYDGEEEGEEEEEYDGEEGGEEEEEYDGEEEGEEEEEEDDGEESEEGQTDNEDGDSEEEAEEDDGGEEYDDEEEEDECTDVAKDCVERSLNDGCILDFANMVQDCQLTCYFCTPEYSIDRVSNIYSHVPQLLYNDQSLADYSAQVDEYMYETIYRNSTITDNVKLRCKNKDSQCTYWAHGGECFLNKQSMMDRCPAACMQCENGMAYATRCPFDDNDPGIWQPGDINKWFAHLVTSPEYAEFSPEIISRPIANPNPKFHEVDGPWIVVLNDFLSEEECEILMELADEEEYEPVQGYKEEEEEIYWSFGRRLCKGECSDADVVAQIEERLEFITSVPRHHNEFFEFVQYSKGDMHDAHSDYIGVEYSRMQGPRIFTVIVFLNSIPQSEDEDADFNGGIEFPFIETTIHPELGRAIIFPNVLDKYPMARDVRTKYAAIPVTEETLYTMNIWSHQRDYKGPLKQDCTM